VIPLGDGIIFQTKLCVGIQQFQFDVYSTRWPKWYGVFWYIFPRFGMFRSVFLGLYFTLLLFIFCTFIFSYSIFLLFIFIFYSNVNNFFPIWILFKNKKNYLFSNPNILKNWTFQILPIFKSMKFFQIREQFFESKVFQIPQHCW
jgi:hypothetical protein